MILRRLHILNVASVVDATIDFSASPLSDSDVYLITGDTGAGKTTILDSICLALFNTTPRLSVGQGDKVKNDIDEMTLKDPRRMMRLNTGEATVELEFEAKGMVYLAEWHVQRGKSKKVTVQLDPVNRLFKNITTGKTITSVGTKDSELQSEIRNVINLDFDQFCRTTMLAQNEFTKFLKSDVDERAAILEKITQTNEFSAAGSKIFEITSLKKTEWEKANEKANDTGLTEDQIEAKKQQIQEFTNAAEQKKTIRDAADKKRDWLKRESELVSEESKAKSDFESANSLIEGETYKNEKLFVEQWNATIEARQWLKEKVEAENNIKSQEESLVGQKSLFQEVLNGYQYACKEEEAYEKELSDITKYLDDNSDKAETFSNVQKISGFLDTIVSKSLKLKELDQKIELEEKKKKENLVPNHLAAKSEFDAELKEKNRICSLVDEKEIQLEKLNLNDLRSKNLRVRDELAEIEKALDYVNGIKEAETKFQEETLRLTVWSQEIEKKKVFLESKLLPDYESAKSKKNAAEMAKDMLRDSVDNFAKQMRSHLTVGCECPVCRQKVAALPLEDKVDEAYQKATKMFEDAKSDFETAESAKNQAESAIDADTVRYNQDKIKHDADKSVDIAKGNAMAACGKCGIESLNDNTKQEIEALKAKKLSYINDELAPSIENGEKIDAELKKLRIVLKSQDNKLEQKKKELENAKEILDICDKDIENSRTLVTDTQSEYDEAFKLVAPLIAKADWKNDWMKEPALFNKELNDSSAVYAKNQERKAHIEKELGPIKKDNENLSSVIASVYDKQREWGDVKAAKAVKTNGLFSKANDLLQKINGIMKALDDAKSKFESKFGLLSDFINQSGITESRIKVLSGKSSVTDLSDKLEKQRQEPERKRELWEKMISDHNKHQEAKPELSDLDTYESMNQLYIDTDGELETLNKNIGIVMNELDADNKKKADNVRFKNEADMALKEYERWNRLNKLLGDKKGDTFRTIAQGYIFGELLHSANAYLQKLEPRYTLKAVDQTLYSALEDAYQGFASRDTSSLSGGESFLVSLSLALALSDIGQGLSVDTLFIDEGFGSLSGRPLANAINTLRSLRGKNGRHVGIISHIQEVRDNIPVQLQVNKSADGSSSTIQVVVQQ